MPDIVNDTMGGRWPVARRSTRRPTPAEIQEDADRLGLGPGVAESTWVPPICHCHNMVNRLGVCNGQAMRWTPRTPALRFATFTPPYVRAGGR